LERLIRAARRVKWLIKPPFNVTPRDRQMWPAAGELFHSDAANARNQWVYHPEYQDPEELCFDEHGGMRFHVRANTNDEWAYIYLDPKQYEWTDYSWRMKFRKMTHFQEYAFNFRYIDFDNRYRYRFEDDLLFFDSKLHGKWRAHARMPFPMVLGAWYDLQIDARGDLFRCYVNGMLMMENREATLPRGSISVILWEIDQATDCVAEIGPMTVLGLQ
jgi:hypothetical protein